MSTQVAGVLVDPFERPLANTAIDIRAINNNFALLPGPTVSIQTNAAGEYNFILEPASYAVSIIIDGRSVYQGAMTITSTTAPGTLPELLKQAEMEAELPLNYAEYFQQVQATVKDDADRAKAAADSVGDELEKAKEAAQQSQQSAESSEQSNIEAQQALSSTQIIANKFQNLDQAVAETQQNAQKTGLDAQQTASDRVAADAAAQRAEDAANSAETVNERNIRVPQDEVINALPPAAQRVNTFATFDQDGKSSVTPASSIATLDSTGKVPLSNIPAAAITEVMPVNSQAEMLSLVADPGDVAIINNQQNPAENGSFILMSSPASNLSNWKSITSDVLVRLGVSSGQSPGSSLIGYAGETVKTFLDSFIASDITLNVPADYATVNDAWAFLKTKRISRNAVVTIKIADGTYSPSTLPPNINHSDGSNIRIIGNQTDGTKVKFSVSGMPDRDGFLVTDGYQINYIDGIWMSADTKATLSNNFTAFLARNGASMYCGPQCRSDNYYYGFAEQFGSVMICQGVQCYGFGDVGIWGFRGGIVRATNAICRNGGDSVNGWGYCYQAEYGAVVEIHGATGTGALIAGAAALSGGVVSAHNADVSSNTGSGFLVRQGGVIEAHNAKANNNGRYAYERVLQGGCFEANNLTQSGNGIGLTNNSPILQETAGQANILAAAGGDMRYDGANHYFNTTGGLQVEIANSASPTARLRMAGGSGAAYLSVSGSATDANLILSGKGNGRVRIGSYNSAGIPTATGFIEVVGDDGRILEIPVKLR